MNSGAGGRGPAKAGPAVGGAGQVSRLALVALLALGPLAGCSSDGPAGERADTAAGAYPDVNDVPSDRPQPPSRVELESVTEGLVADRRAARHAGSSGRRRPLEIDAPTGGGVSATSRAPSVAASASAPAPSPAAPAAVTRETLDPPSATGEAGSGESDGASDPAPRVRVAPGTVANAPKGTVPQSPDAPATPVATAGSAATAGAGAVGGAGPIVVDSRGVHAGPQAMEMAMMPAPGQPRPLSAYSNAGVSVSSRVGVVYFASGSSSLDANDSRVVREIAAYQRQYGGVLRVIGHASSRTADMDPSKHKLINLRVSAQRANAVARALMNAGVSADQIFVGAVADEEKVYREVMPSGEAHNRRTEVFLDY